MPGTEADIDLSIVLVAYNSGDVLPACLRSVKTQTLGVTYELIVVDNASSDGTLGSLEAEHPDVTVIRNADNAGFARASNQGIEIAVGRRIVLLNCDTELRDDAFTRMMARMDDHEDIGVLGPRMVDASGARLATAHHFGTWKTVFFATFRVDGLVPKALKAQAARLAGKEAVAYVSALDSDEPIDTDWLSGACLMVSREAIDDVGVLDERYFLYMEDEDWCRRIRCAGWRIVLTSPH